MSRIWIMYRCEADTENLFMFQKLFENFCVTEIRCLDYFFPFWGKYFLCKKYFYIPRSQWILCEYRFWNVCSGAVAYLKLMEQEVGLDSAVHKLDWAWNCNCRSMEFHKDWTVQLLSVFISIK